MANIIGHLDFIAAGDHFVALDLPEQDAVLKLLRPGGPSGKGGRSWRRRLPAAYHRRKRVARATAAGLAFRALAESKHFALSDCFPETEIVDEVDVSFEWEGRVHRHQGSAYVQGRVEMFHNGTPLDGFDWVEFAGDSVKHKIEWSNGLKPISDRAVCLEFRLRDAQLFGFDLH